VDRCEMREGMKYWSMQRKKKGTSIERVATRAEDGEGEESKLRGGEEVEGPEVRSTICEFEMVFEMLTLLTSFLIEIDV